MCRHENEERSTKKKWNSTKNRRWRDFVLFLEFFHKKDLLSDFKKIRRSFKKIKKTKKNILKIQMTRRSKRKKNQKIIKTIEEKFVKKSNHNKLSFIFENESRFHFFRYTKKNKWVNSFNKSVTNKTWKFRKNIFKCEKNLLFFFVYKLNSLRRVVFRELKMFIIETIYFSQIAKRRRNSRNQNTMSIEWSRLSIEQSAIKKTSKFRRIFMIVKVNCQNNYESLTKKRFLSI